jgi:nucleoside-diphosphate-sugar epimerase
VTSGIGAAPLSLAALKHRRVLVTGGTGFLGTHLVRQLIALGADVHLLTRRSPHRSRFGGTGARPRLLRGDIRVRKDVRRAIEASNPQVVFHLAAYGVDPRKRNPATIISTNVMGVVNLLEATTDVPYARLVNTGTCFEYGNRSSKISEAAEVDPLNVYAASKIAAWHICNLHRRLYGKPIVTIRPFTFFGPFERRDRLVPSVILSVLQKRPIRITSGKQTRDYTYVEDMADAFLRAAVADGVVGESINVGSGEDFPVREIVERIRGLMQSDVPVETGALETRREESWRLCCDNGKARALLGWTPTVTFEEGVFRTVEWFRRNA